MASQTSDPALKGAQRFHMYSGGYGPNFCCNNWVAKARGTEPKATSNLNDPRVARLLELINSQTPASTSLIPQTLEGLKNTEWIVKLVPLPETSTKSKYCLAPTGIEGQGLVEMLHGKPARPGHEYGEYKFWFVMEEQRVIEVQLECRNHLEEQWIGVIFERVLGRAEREGSGRETSPIELTLD